MAELVLDLILQTIAEWLALVFLPEQEKGAEAGAGITTRTWKPRIGALTL